MYDPADQTQLPIVIGEEGVLIGDVVAAQPRRTPQVINDQIPGIDTDPNLVAESAGLLNIRSVYDLDGVDAANPDIQTLADPAATIADERPARFLRVVKPVSLPDDDVLDFDKNRCIKYRLDEDPPADATAHCIALALTYHQRK